MTTQCNATKLMFHELKTREVVGRFDGGAAGHLPGFVVVDDVHVHGGIVLEVEPLPDVDAAGQRLPMVVLPLPEPPTSATLRPGSTSRLKSSATGGAISIRSSRSVVSRTDDP